MTPVSPLHHFATIEIFLTCRLDQAPSILGATAGLIPCRGTKDKIQPLGRTHQPFTHLPLTLSHLQPISRPTCTGQDMLCPGCICREATPSLICLANSSFNQLCSVKLHKHLANAFSVSEAMLGAGSKRSFRSQSLQGQAYRDSFHITWEGTGSHGGGWMKTWCGALTLPWDLGKS